MEYNIKVIIKNIDVDDRYYSFEYEVFLDWKSYKSDYYESDYEWWRMKEQEDFLRSGNARDIALVNAFE